MHLCGQCESRTKRHHNLIFGLSKEGTESYWAIEAPHSCPIHKQDEGKSEEETAICSFRLRDIHMFIFL